VAQRGRVLIFFCVDGTNRLVWPRVTPATIGVDWRVFLCHLQPAPNKESVE
jgi:hypothetical protein